MPRPTRRGWQYAGMRSVRNVVVFALAIALGMGCASSESRLSSVKLDGGNSRGRFEATVTYPDTIKHGPHVRLFHFEHQNAGGAIASYMFEVALERAPNGCAIQNMMTWSDERESLRIGSWPTGGLNLRSGTPPFKTVQDVPLASNCRGRLQFAVVAVPKGGLPIVKHIAIAVT